MGLEMGMGIEMEGEVMVGMEVGMVVMAGMVVMVEMGLEKGVGLVEMIMVIGLGIEMEGEVAVGAGMNSKVINVSGPPAHTVAPSYPDISALTNSWQGSPTLLEGSPLFLPPVLPPSTPA